MSVWNLENAWWDCDCSRIIYYYIISIISLNLAFLKNNLIILPLFWRPCASHSVRFFHFLRHCSELWRCHIHLNWTQMAQMCVKFHPLTSSRRSITLNQRHCTSSVGRLQVWLLPAHLFFLSFFLSLQLKNRTNTKPVISRFNPLSRVSNKALLTIKKMLIVSRSLRGSERASIESGDARRQQRRGVNSQK